MSNPIHNTLWSLCASEAGTLTVRQHGILAKLRYHSNGLIISKLAAELSLLKAPVGRAVERLEMLGLVSKHPDQNDQRVAWVRLTSSGTKFCKKFYGDAL